MLMFWVLEKPNIDIVAFLKDYKMWKLNTRFTESQSKSQKHLDQVKRQKIREMMVD